MSREKVICQNPDGSELSVPVEHTSMNKREDTDQRQPGFGYDFGYDELLALGRIVSDIMCRANYVATSGNYDAI